MGHYFREVSKGVRNGQQSLVDQHCGTLRICSVLLLTSRPAFAYSYVEHNIKNTCFWRTSQQCRSNRKDLYYTKAATELQILHHRICGRHPIVFGFGQSPEQRGTRHAGGGGRANAGSTLGRFIYAHTGSKGVCEG